MKVFYLAVFAFFFTACQSQHTENQAATVPSTTTVPATAVVENLDKATFAAALSTATSPQLIDVRTPREYDTGHIENAVNIDFLSPDFEEKILAQLDKDKPVFVYCQVGGRSAKAATVLKKQGFKTIYELKGGYAVW